MSFLAVAAAAGTAMEGAGIASLVGAEFGTAALLGELGLGGFGMEAMGAAGAGGAGGLSNLTPLLQGEFGLASLNPEIAAQVSQAANLGNAVGSGTGAASMFPTESMLAQAEAAQYGGQLSPFNPAGSPINGGEFNILNNADAANLTRNIDPRMMNSVAPTADANAETAKALSENPGLTQGPISPYPTPSTLNADYNRLMSQAMRTGQDLTQEGKTTDPNIFQQAMSAFGGLPKPLQYGLGGIGAIKALNYLDGNKYGTPATEKYEGPLSRFKYNPDRYTPSVATPNVYRPSYAGGGLAALGGYSDGGRMLKGPGDGMSDSIPATIAGKQPARLANEEFVVPADVVSHLGNGSSDAGAKQLYKMMDKVRSARTGKKAQAKQINPNKYMPA
jgi:hypothetical protein